MKNYDPIWLAYLWESWGPTPEQQRELKALDERIRSEGGAGASSKFREERARGKKAYKAKLELGKVFDTSGELATKLWIFEARKSWLNDHKIVATLERELKKRIEREQNLRNRHSHRVQRTKIHTGLIDGLHPNCLRALKPSDSWTIYIDETGAEFDSTAEGSANSNQMGRVVALAVPNGVELPDCSGFHAVDRTFSEVDEVLQRLLDAPVGVFGFSVLDTSARHRYWIGHILHLVRWTLLQLPVPADGRKCRVRILIEQRGTYGPETDLRATTQVLEGELAAIDPQRFDGLALDMGFMDKHHPMNGYVDVIAFTWGSSDRSNKDRLRKSKLPGHCFVKANERSLHHLFLALTRGGPLAPVDWYTLCAAAATDQDGSFLRRELDSLGKMMASFPRQWELYLEEVQMRLAGKKYSLSELGSAIAWLQQYANHSQVVPGTLQLQLDSSALALANHRGQIQNDLVLRCLEWIKNLEDEAPQLAAEALLRMASTMTNNFEFCALQNSVEAWLLKPISVAGLLNYGKLQSTRGQMHAFSGDSTAAVACFHAASASFSRLSDPRQVVRETQQTAIYEMTARMDAVPFDDESVESENVVNAICRLLGSRDPEAISRSISASDQTKRFEHHLWLRAMNRFPQKMACARAAYLDNHNAWSTASDHPWPLILAYRAWLLKDAGNMEEARAGMEASVAACLDDDHGVTLEWMGLVLSNLARGIGVPLSGSEEGTEARLRESLPKAPWMALESFAAEVTSDGMPTARIWHHLSECLPFNFH